MRRETAYKVLIVALTAAACIALLRWRAGGLGAPGGPGGHERDRGGAAGHGSSVGAARTLPSELPGTVLDEPTVLALLPHLKTSEWMLFDPVTIVRVRPDHVSDLPWPDHPGGKVVIRTNEHGFREDAPTAEVADGPRVVVIGDSHTFGLVNNDESLANRLEARLATSLPGGAEVINASTTGTGPYEHLASLGEQLDLHPDLVVVVICTGNDFSNAMAFSDFFTKRPWPRLPGDARERFEAARSKAREVMAQGLSQAFDFSCRPENADVGLVATTSVVERMADLCRERGVAFLVALLPAKEDVDSDDLPRRRDLAETLMMSPADIALNRTLALALRDALQRRGIDVLDLLPAMKGRDQPLYWRTDYHLNVAGHAAVAQALEPRVRELLAPKR
jgi:lysophospholipase L1-like esterase